MNRGRDIVQVTVRQRRFIEQGKRG